jgi:hypothetical protein
MPTGLNRLLRGGESGGWFIWAFYAAPAIHPGLKPIVLQEKTSGMAEQ